MHSLIHTWRIKRLLCLRGLDKYIHSAYSDIMAYQQTLPEHILSLSDLTECQPFCYVLDPGEYGKVMGWSQTEIVYVSMGRVGIYPRRLWLI